MSKYLPEGWNQDKIDEALEFQSQQKDKFMNKAEKPEFEPRQDTTVILKSGELAKLLDGARTAGRKAQMVADCELIRSIDPLGAVCDWENNDAIAYAVQKYLCTAIRNQGDVK